MGRVLPRPNFDILRAKDVLGLLVALRLLGRLELQKIYIRNIRVIKIMRGFK